MGGLLVGEVGEVGEVGGSDWASGRPVVSGGTARGQPRARPPGQRQRDRQEAGVTGDFAGVGGLAGRDLAAVAEAAAVDL
jgi:hypothetical protein